MDDQRFEAGARYGGAPVAANKSVGRAGGEAENEGNEVPGNRAQQTGEQNRQRPEGEAQSQRPDASKLCTPN